ncbi:DUF2860 family protein [Psychromonas sp. KJ10-10]|uniref:DUF2860 family protein n=1 Tax=Psychromonas sp. KJ10-10 TaxID=3391823 RepID=UPI0039B5B0D5
MKTIFSSLLLGRLSTSLVYAQDFKSEAGWQFSLSLNSAYVSGQSNISVTDDNETMSDLYNEAETSNDVIVFPLPEAKYLSKDLKTEFFLGASREQISFSPFSYELGVSQELDNKSKLTFAYSPQLPLFNETWQDPYVVGQSRQETDIDTHALRVEFSGIAGGPITLKYGFALTRIEDDQSGQSYSSLTLQEQQDLQRDSQFHRVAVETMLPIFINNQTKVFFKPNLQYTTRLADGEAISYDDYNLKLGFLIFSGRHTSITNVSLGSTLYKQENPIFDMKQDSINIGISSIYSYAQPFNYKPLTFTLMAGYSQKDSDITFFDESGFIVSTGMTYTF